MAGPETTLSEKVSCVRSSTTLRQVLKREAVLSDPASPKVNSGISSHHWLSFLSLLVGVVSLPKRHLSSTACLPELEAPSFTSTRLRSSPTARTGRRRTKEPPRLRPRSPTACNTEEATVRPKSSPRGSLNTQKVSALCGSPPDQSHLVTLQLRPLPPAQSDRPSLGRPLTSSASRKYWPVTVSLEPASSSLKDATEQIAIGSRSDRNCHQEQ